MKIFFRYLLLRLVVPFLVTLGACALIWIMVDLYGNLDGFLEHKINVLLILHFYLLNIPSMLVQVLPAAVLFSTLYTLMSLNRRSEIVALQSGGMAPIWLFSPFFIFTIVMTIILAVDLSGFAAQSLVTRDRLLKEVKGQKNGAYSFTTLPYVDNVNHRVWYFQDLDAGAGRGTGVVEILQRDPQGHDLKKYSAQEAEWAGEFWRLNGVHEIIFTADGSVQDQKSYAELDLPEVTTPPTQLSLIVSQPEQLSIGQLSEYIATSTSSQDSLAKYRTEWWYRVLYPFSLMVLLLYALLNGMSTDRRGTAAGVIWCIVILVLFFFFMNLFRALGDHNRLPPYVAAATTEVVFGVIGLWLLASQYGWWWQLREYWKEWHADTFEEDDDSAKQPL